jgi:hypothetical protein
MKYLYSIAILVLLIVFAVVLYLCLRKTDKSTPLQPWTGDQLNRMMDIIRPMLPSDIDKESVECLVSDVSRKMSFDDFVSKNSTKQYEALFGVKGKWADCTKRNIMKAVMGITKNGPCSLCIVGTLEQNYSPFDVNHKSDSDKQAVLTQVMMSCDACKSN